MFFTLLASLITTDVRYEQATRTAIQAAYKQSGYEEKASVVSDVIQANGLKWIKDKGLSPVATVGSAVVPVVLNKKIEIHTGNLILSGSAEKKEAIWTFAF